MSKKKKIGKMEIRYSSTKEQRQKTQCNCKTTTTTTTSSTSTTTTTTTAPDICQPCEDVEFCCTLVIPQGFSIPANNLENKKQFIADNFELAAYFVPDCFKCKEEPCKIPTNCGSITVTQLSIKGTIKFIADVSNITGDTADGSAAICCSDIVCIKEFTPVCLDCGANCQTLEITGGKVQPSDVRLVGTSCSGDTVWEIKGTLIFDC